MRFYNYINEEYWSSYLNTIKKDCKPFLKNWRIRYNKNFLWTGRYEKDFVRKKVRKNRTPRDTPLELHEFVDNWFKYEFGIRFRSNSVFCTSNMGEAEDYGHLYAIFPIGKYTTLSSGKIGDLWKDLLDEINNNSWNFFTEKEQDEFLEDLEIKLSKAKYQLNKYHHNSEIMINCKEYYILNYNILKEMSKEDFIL